MTGLSAERTHRPLAPLAPLAVQGKHCTVSKWLETQPAHYIAAVFDGDVVAAAPTRGLAGTSDWGIALVDLEFGAGGQVDRPWGGRAAVQPLQAQDFGGDGRAVGLQVGDRK